MPFQGLPQIKIIAKFLLIVCNDVKLVKTFQEHLVGVEASLKILEIMLIQAS